VIRALAEGSSGELAYRPVYRGGSRSLGPSTPAPQGSGRSRRSIGLLLRRGASGPRAYGRSRASRGRPHMTWVIGSPSMWGYGVAISDIRVSFPDGRTADCLQKVYGVGRFIAAGFAGSVRFGFSALQDLLRFLEPIAADEAWIPGKAAFWWYRRARRLWTMVPDDVQRLGGQIMLIGVSPNVDLGIPGWARPAVAIMEAPAFFPRFLRLNEVAAIGSGRGVAPYIAEVERCNHDRQLRLMEAGSPGGYAEVLMNNIRQTVEENPDPYVSPYFHLCSVRRGELLGYKSNYTIVERGEQRHVRMPRVATSWEEFMEMCVATGHDYGAASA
jgi:hypothetical protein